MSVKFPNHRIPLVVPPDMKGEVFYEYPDTGVIWFSFDLPAHYVINTDSKSLIHKKIVTRSEIADSIGMLYFLMAMLFVYVIAFAFSTFPFLPYVLLIWVIYFSASYLISLYENINNKRLYNRLAKAPNSLPLDCRRLNLLATDSTIGGKLWLFDQNPKGKIGEWFGLPEITRSRRNSRMPLPVKAIMVFEDDVDLTLFKIAH